MSIVLWTDTWKPDSFYDKIASNRKQGLHTLCLLGKCTFNPLSPSVKIQTLLTCIHTFSYGTNWENLLKIIAISVNFGDHFLDSHYLLS